MSLKLINRAKFLFALVVEIDEYENYTLNAGSCKVDSSFKHPYTILYLPNRLICILPRWEHVKARSPVGIEAEQDYFPG